MRPPFNRLKLLLLTDTPPALPEPKVSAATELPSLIIISPPCIVIFPPASPLVSSELAAVNSIRPVKAVVTGALSGNSVIVLPVP